MDKNDHIYDDSRLRGIFGQMPREDMPARLRGAIMQSAAARYARRRAVRSDLRGIAWASGAGLFIIAAAVAMLRYVGVKFPKIDISKIFEQRQAVEMPENMSLWIMVVAAALLLFMADTIISSRRRRRQMQQGNVHKNS